MFTLKFYQFVLGLALCIQEFSAERRIVVGAAVKDDSSTGYVVYLRESRTLKTRAYKSPWICEGAIVTTTHILTSAACVKNVDNILAVAGTRNLRSYEDFKNCMNDLYVKKVVICVPKKYKFNYTVEHWIDNEIALVEMETPYFFNYYRADHCYQYNPKPIEVNYDPLNEGPGTDAVVFGWGHKLRYGSETETVEGTLNFAPVLVVDKEICKDHYFRSPNLLPVIDKEKICTHGSGNVNYEGKMNDKDLDRNSSYAKLKTICRKSHNPETMNEQIYNQNGTIANQNSTNVTINSRRNEPSKDDIDFKNPNIGICQNDHGGPLVRWLNGREVLIGLASVFMIGDNETCVGPFLYKITASHRKFIQCVTNSGVTTKNLRRSCNDFNEAGIQVYRKLVSWDKQPMSIPAFKPRAQVPISQFRFTNPRTS